VGSHRWFDSAQEAPLSPPALACPPGAPASHRAAGCALARHCAAESTRHRPDPHRYSECRSGPGGLLRQGLLIGSKARRRFGHRSNLGGRQAGLGGGVSSYASRFRGGTRGRDGSSHGLIARRQIYRSIGFEDRIYRSTCSYLLVFLCLCSRNRRVLIECSTFLLLGAVASNDRRVAVLILAMDIPVSGDPPTLTALRVGEVPGSGSIADLAREPRGAPSPEE
jgi:hypothetical protein